MNTNLGAVVIGQSGAGTPVSNASLEGALDILLETEGISHIYGMANGIRGLLDDRLYLLEEEDREELRLLKNTPASVLGSCRYRLKNPEESPEEYQHLLEVFRRRDIRSFLYIGGNDSMEACYKLNKYMARNRYPLSCIGIPKSLDNDLYGTDHCPGYGSAAKYIATSVMELWADSQVYDTGIITLVELPGRQSGWLAAAASIATYKGCGPDLLYLPEIEFDGKRFLEDVKRLYQEKGKVMVAFAEGIHAPEGKPLLESDDEDDEGPRGKNAGRRPENPGEILAEALRRELDAKVHSLRLTLLPRTATHIASRTDVEEAYAAGRAAAMAALQGKNGVMAGCVCERELSSSPEIHIHRYSREDKFLPLEIVIRTEKMVPREWILPEGKGMEQEYIRYVLPLIQGEASFASEDGLPRYARLKKIQAPASK